jgi:anti-sigma factor RsiW
VSAIHESTGSYAVHALDMAELAEFEEHLSACPSCSHEVARFSETAAELAALTETTPPPALRDNILSAIRQLPQPLAGEPAEPAATRPTPRTRPAPRTPPTGRPTGPRRALPGSEVLDEPEPPPPPPVDELAERRQRRRNSVLTGLVAAMLALLLGLGGVVYTLYQERQEQVAQNNRELELYGADDARVVVAELKNGGQASFVVSEQLNRALFIGTDLPDPGPDQRYQLWTMTGEEPKWVTATSVARDNQVADPGTGAKVFFRGDIARADFLCVNLEPLDNTTNKPTTPPLASAEI